MPSRPHQRSIHPKISSMPRKQSEATTHLEIYKMSVEKNRLQQELENLKNREKYIQKRLAEIDQQTEALLAQVHPPQSASSTTSQHQTQPNNNPPTLSSAFDFEQVYVEY